MDNSCYRAVDVPMITKAKMGVIRMDIEQTRADMAIMVDAIAKKISLIFSGFNSESRYCSLA